MGIYHIVTFADNNAIDYFAKQGFELRTDIIDEYGIHNDKLNSATKDNPWPIPNQQDLKIDKLYGYNDICWSEIIKPQHNAKYIKTYTGASLMHCRMIKNINYCKLNEHLIQNRKLLLSRIGKISNSIKRRNGLSTKYRKRWKQEKNFCIKINKIPGITESGFKYDPEKGPKLRSKLFEESVGSQMVEVTARISGIIKQLENHSKVGVFARPVDETQAQDYYHIIKKPMDLSKIKNKLNQYQYTSIRPFINDFKLMIANCKLFNPKDNVFHKHAIEFDQYFDSLIQQY